MSIIATKDDKVAWVLDKQITNKLSVINWGKRPHYKITITLIDRFGAAHVIESTDYKHKVHEVQQ